MRSRFLPVVIFFAFAGLGFAQPPDLSLPDVFMKAQPPIGSMISPRYGIVDMVGESGRWFTMGSDPVMPRKFKRRGYGAEIKIRIWKTGVLEQYYEVYCPGKSNPMDCGSYGREASLGFRDVVKGQQLFVTSGASLRFEKHAVLAPTGTFRWVSIRPDDIRGWRWPQ